MHFTNFIIIIIDQVLFLSLGFFLPLSNMCRPFLDVYLLNMNYISTHSAISHMKKLLPVKVFQIFLKKTALNGFNLKKYVKYLEWVFPPFERRCKFGWGWKKGDIP